MKNTLFIPKDFMHLCLWLQQLKFWTINLHHSVHIIITLNAFYLVFMYNIHRAYNCKRCKQYELYCMKLYEMFHKFSNKIFLLSAKVLYLIWDLFIFFIFFNVLISNFPKKKQLYYAGKNAKLYLVFCISDRTATLQLTSGAPSSTNILVRLFFLPKNI